MDELFSYRQLQYHIEKCKKLSIENASIIQGNLTENLNEMLVKGTFVLNEVADKFHKQLKQLSRSEESKSQLQERIKKAAVYFFDKTEKHLSMPLAQGSFETDNKEVRKQINETLKKITELIAVKKACLESCKKGFTLKDYLHVRAVAALEKVRLKPSVPKIVVPTTTENPALYERLKIWRNDVAKETNLPHYMIAHQKLLLAISNALPGNESQLKAIKGMGGKKLKQFGEDILSIVHDYCSEQNITPNQAIIKEPKKEPKKNTKAISMELFRQGQTIGQIAKTREMAMSTIESHLSHFVGTGELKLNQFVDAKTAKIIINHFQENPEGTLSSAKEALADSITYGELKFVRQHLNYLEKQ